MAVDSSKIWMMRTYAGHSSAKESNHLYKTNLAKGQTGLSVAFDLPTQTGYDSDHILAKGEVGKVGVPIGHIGDMRILFADLPLDKMNTSMTINAPAPWLLALYVALADERGTPRHTLYGTVQNDLLKEYLSRGTYIFPPEPSVRLTGDVIAFCLREAPKWNPLNFCSYHLQEAGATPVQEVSFALAGAIAILDHMKNRKDVTPDDIAPIVGRMSFFVNSSVTFITEICKMKAFGRLWDKITKERYGVTDEKLRRFRYGVQVNSLGLTEQQPENNVYRILLSALGVTLSAEARARAVQLPAWNEALGLPRPWDQQWSLRLQQVLAYETDILDYPDIFAGSYVIEAEIEKMMQAIEADLERIAQNGGAVKAIENGMLKAELVSSHAQRRQDLETKEKLIIGVNSFTETEASPLTAGDIIQKLDHSVEAKRIADLQRWKNNRDMVLVEQSLQELKKIAENHENIMEISITCAKAGVTTGEWAGALREVFGEYRAPTGALAPAPRPGEIMLDLRKRVNHLAEILGLRPKILLGKPGLDGHSNGIEQLAVRARECGFDVVYEGIRLTPAQIVKAALEENVHLIGISILSGGHLEITTDIIERMKHADMLDIPLAVGGIIPEEDANILKKTGVTAVYTPKDYDLNMIMADFVTIIENSNK